MLFSDWIWGPPKVTEAQAQEAKNKKVAELEALVKLRESVAKDAEVAFQDIANVYEIAIKHLPEGNKDRMNLCISYKMHESDYIVFQRRLLDARKELAEFNPQPVIAVLVPPVAALYQQPIGPKTALETEFDEYRSLAQNNPDTAVSTSKKVRVPSRVKTHFLAPPLVRAHFNGKNCEHISTSQTRAEREEASHIRAGINVSVFKRTLENSLSLKMDSSKAKVDPLLAVKREQARVFEQDPEVSAPTVRPVLRLTGLRLLSALHPLTPGNYLDDESKEAILKRRIKSSY